MESGQEQWRADSDVIFTAISTASYPTWEEARQAVCQIYLPDRSFSRAGISDAFKRLEDFYRSR